MNALRISFMCSVENDLILAGKRFLIVLLSGLRTWYEASDIRVCLIRSRIGVSSILGFEFLRVR